ncbi:hypothetical protein Cs7R123_05370 [Catellatospora sp. TT07R-123]|uniref:DUF6289 family protein n=1 Tax=Catellatospora sp. TT07R-123 TaxID=2733863 RepID=UPI001B29E203|nr:DUF6289 family protein [Catellatospora sp. TT07R-123]GHJ43195.1 hypothetical protein Cs7R123_05370 [Catellatospora sp. TT07R-123]
MLRRLGLAAALVTIGSVAVVLPGAPAQARACTIDHYCYTTWYADAAHTSVVGQLYEDCGGSRSTWGTRSGYATFAETPC